MMMTGCVHDWRVLHKTTQKEAEKTGTMTFSRCAKCGARQEIRTETSGKFTFTHSKASW